MDSSGHILAIPVADGQIGSQNCQNLTRQDGQEHGWTRKALTWISTKLAIEHTSLNFSFNNRMFPRPVADLSSFCPSISAVVSLLKSCRE